MRNRLGMMAALAAMAGGMGKDKDDVIFDQAPLYIPGVITAIKPTQFGIYRAGSKTHKQFLRRHHLGKFRKRK